MLFTAWGRLKGTALERSKPAHPNSGRRSTTTTLTLSVEPCWSARLTSVVAASSADVTDDITWQAWGGCHEIPEPVCRYQQKIVAL